MSVALSLPRSATVRAPFKWGGLVGWVAPLALLALWQLVSRQGGALAYVFIPLDGLGRAFAEAVVSGELPRHLAATLGRVLFGWSVGGLLGLALGTAMALSRPVDRIVGPVYHAVRQVPILGWIPLLGLWFGYGEAPRLIIVSLAAFYPMTLNSFEGLRGVDPKQIEVGRTLTLTSVQLFTRVRLPAALPMLATGLLHALTFAWISAIGVEILFGSGAGLGAMMEAAQVAGRVEIVWLGLLVVSVVGLLLTQLFTRITRRLSRWRSPQP